MTARKPVTDTIIIAKDYSKYPGPRFTTQGPYSGQDFYHTCLKPKFEVVLAKGGLLFVDLDGTAGYLSSFFEESFGELARTFGTQCVLDHLDIKTEEEPYLSDEIMAMIRNV